MLKPVKVTTAPVAQRDHHLSHIFRHSPKILFAISVGHNDFAVTLRECRSVSSEGAIILVELLLDMELQVGVNARGGSWGKLANGSVKKHVGVTRSIAVAV